MGERNARGFAMNKIYLKGKKNINWQWKHKETIGRPQMVYDKGYEKGVAKGYEKGLQVGSNLGYNKGFMEGYDFGYERGYQEGKNLGYKAGYQEGLTGGIGLEDEKKEDK